MALSRVFLVGSGVDIVIGANTVTSATIVANVAVEIGDAGLNPFLLLGVG